MTQVSDEQLQIYLLVRFSTKKSFSDWTKDGPNYLQLAQDFLDAKLGECSVYKIEDVKDKTRVIAGHFTTLNRNRVDKVACIEIKGALISSSGLELHKSEGRTGITFIDEKHHDIRGSEDNFSSLVELIIKDYFQGDQPFIGIEPEQLKVFMKEFSNLSVDEIKDYAKKRCLKALGEG